MKRKRSSGIIWLIAIAIIVIITVAYVYRVQILGFLAGAGLVIGDVEAPGGGPGP